MYEIINNEPLQVKEYKGQRVVTFKDIDRVHERPEGTARRNFNKNREYFIEGKDYFVRNSYEAKNEFGVTAPNGLILITEYGYMMLVKSFTDKLAWEVQRQLINIYFRAKEINNSHDKIIYEKLELLEQKINVFDKKINVLDKKIDALEKKAENIAEEAIKTLNPCFYALDSKIESVAKTIIRAVSGNVKLLAVYVDYLIKRR